MTNETLLLSLIPWEYEMSGRVLHLSMRAHLPSWRRLFYTSHHHYRLLGNLQGRGLVQSRQVQGGVWWFRRLKILDLPR